MAKHHGMEALTGLPVFCHFGHEPQESNRFGRMFHLAPLTLPGSELLALGAKKGPMDGGKAPKRTTSVPVGQVFFGQFVDHDITLDTESSLSSVSEPGDVENVRTPTLDLDCIYGSGPEAHPFLYHAAGDFAGVKLLAGADGTAVSQPANLAREDLTRSSQGTAIIGDPRNDENRIISQLQLAMIRFHNKVADHVDALDAEALEGKSVFEKTRELVTWHYQWVVIYDFLTHMCGNFVVNDILGNGRKHYCPSGGKPFIPVEFSVAAYRFGHSMIPQKIQIQKGKAAQDLFGTALGNGFSPLSDPKAVVDWRELVETSTPRGVQKAEKLDRKLATRLLELPFITDPQDVASLASRNLLRGQAFQLPSGEQVARALARPDSEISAVSQAARTVASPAADLSPGTPLWFYILVEAEKVGRQATETKFEKREGLGPVGARIVAETLIGLIELDRRSFLGSNRNWHPANGVGVATLGEMLTY